ncbi:MAG: glycoside hydrolase family 3 N-terminal domain-containing protein [Anaerolineales bacterium]
MASLKQRIDDLVSQMNLDEKISQMGSCWMYELQTQGQIDEEKIAARLGSGIGQITRVAGASTLDPVSAAKTVNRLQKYLLDKTRLGIPAIVHEECCSGAMVLGGTMFPQMIGLASTFRPALAKAMTEAIRQQLLAIGARQALAPVLDIARDSRWGRVEETFGEDPMLVSHFGVAYIEGLQNESLAEGVMATGKHFIGHSNSQGGLNCAPVHMGFQEVYEVFLAPFQAAIRDAGLATMMNAYPELDGVVVAASHQILTDMLRGELGFDGLLVSDYEAIEMIHNFHFAAADESTAASLALAAGIDVELPTTVCYGDPLKTALDEGKITMDMIDRSVCRHLQKKFELGLFENPYVDEGAVLECYETDANRSLARQIAHESMVLLKNDGVLPLGKTIKTLAVIGPNAHEGRNQLGDYSYAAMKDMMAFVPQEDSSFIDVNEAEFARHDIKIPSILEGIQALVSPETEVRYARGCDNLDPDTSGLPEALEAAKDADAVILVLGDRSGMTPLCTSGETRDSADLLLPGVQRDLAEAILENGQQVVVVLVNGRPYAIPRIAENANAILEAWLPGEEGGPAVADVLFGDFNPGGKLPITFPRSVGQLPLFYNRKLSGTRSHWYGDYVSETTDPLYPFGHGLSYTSFVYSNLSISKAQVKAGEVLDISLHVKNTGPLDGDEVIQLYVHDEYASTPRPVKELKGYVRQNLKSGEEKKVIFHLQADQLAFYDNDLQLVLESGPVQIMLGSSSDDIHLSGRVEIVGEDSTPIQQRMMNCPVTVE